MEQDQLPPLSTAVVPTGRELERIRVVPSSAERAVKHWGHTGVQKQSRAGGETLSYLCREQREK